MKKLFLILSFCGFGLASYGQFSSVGYKSEEFTRFRASKTYLVKTNNPEYDTALEEAMQSSWKITPYEIISEKEFNAKVPDKSASFIIPIEISRGNNQTYHFLALFNGGKKKVSNYSYSNMVAYAPYNHYIDETKFTNSGYRVRNMVEGMVKAVELVQEKNMSGLELDIANQLKSHYNKSNSDIKNRTLLFCKDSIGPKMKQADIAGIYPYKFEICSKEKLAQVIKDKDPNYYYYQPAITLNKMMFVVDPTDGNVVYFDYKVMGLAINKSNIEELAKAVKDGK